MRTRRLATTTIALYFASAASISLAEEPAGILPIPNYSGSLSERAHIFGDFGGNRTNWAEKGFQFDIEYTQWTDTVVDGGTDSSTHFGGNLTYNIEIDLMRAGLIPGALIDIRAESRFGDSGNLSTGRVVPMNTAALSPTNYAALDDGYDLALSQFTYLQCSLKSSG